MFRSSVLHLAHHISADMGVRDAKGNFLLEEDGREIGKRRM